MIARFENVQGYNLVKAGTGKNAAGEMVAQYLFTLKKKNPLTYHDGKGGKMQPNRKYDGVGKVVARLLTDMGTIPKILQLLIPKDKYLLSFFYHDSAWEHGGIWYCAPGFETYSFVEMGRMEANRLLRDMVLIEGAMDKTIKPGTLKREARWIKRAVDLAAFWFAIKRRTPRHKRVR